MKKQTLVSQKCLNYYVSLKCLLLPQDILYTIERWWNNGRKTLRISKIPGLKFIINLNWNILVILNQHTQFNFWTRLYSFPNKVFRNALNPSSIDQQKLKFF